MDRELATMVANTASRAGMELSNLPPLLKEHGAAGDSDAPIKMAIASAIYEIGLIEARVFEQYPDLKKEAEARLNKYGRSYY